MKETRYKVLIISCWVLLLLALSVKLFGAKMFDIIVNNQNFVSFCSFIDHHLVLTYILATAIYIPTNYLIYLTITNQTVGKDLWVLPIIMITPVTKGYLGWVGMILDFVVLLIIPLIKFKGKKWYRPVIGVALVFIYQLLMLLVRNINPYLGSSSAVIGLIMNIDYYIIIILFYLYSTKNIKERK